MCQMSWKKLFISNIKHVDAKYLKTNIPDVSWLWHLQFGYLKFSTLKSLTNRRRMVNGYQISTHQVSFVKNALLANNQKKSVCKESTYHTRRPLELIHIHKDIYELISPTSYS